MKTTLTLLILCLSVNVEARKMVLSPEVKHGPIIQDSCGNFADGVSALERIQETSSFDSDGQIALYNFSSRALAALYREKMKNERNPVQRSRYRAQYLLACKNVG